MNTQPRILCHFSCGAASAVATKLALDKYGADNCEIINIHIAEEHPDNQRFYLQIVEILKVVRPVHYTTVK